MFLQRYGEQSVRWQLCAPYRCKNKCLGGVCFYSDLEHKSNNMIKNDKNSNTVVEFQVQEFFGSNYDIKTFFSFKALNVWWTFTLGKYILVNIFLRFTEWFYTFWLGIGQRWWNWHVHRHQFWWIFRLFLYIKIRKIMSNCCKLDDLTNIGLRNPNLAK